MSTGTWKLWNTTSTAGTALDQHMLMVYRESMLGSMTGVAVKPQPAKTELALVMPTPMPLSIDDEFNRLELEEHAALCKELGVSSDSVSKIGELELRQYLRERSVQVYDYKSVMDYLKSIAPKPPAYSSYEIVWKPLRDADLKLHSIGPISGQRYLKPVPIHILQLVRDMERERPDQLYFSVSDYEAKNPDPFLAVTTKSFSPWPALIIAHWDEPGYKVKTEKHS